jgi:hypothetical protein
LALFLSKNGGPFDMSMFSTFCTIASQVIGFITTMSQPTLIARALKFSSSSSSSTTTIISSGQAFLSGRLL